jgi:HEAT repeat protein
MADWPPYAQDLADRLQGRAPLADTLGDLSHFLRYTEHPAAYAPLFLPELTMALEGGLGATDAREMATVLGRLGPAALPALIGLAKHRHAGVRQSVAAALAKVGREAPGAFDVLAALAADEAQAVRAEACRALAAALPGLAAAGVLAERLSDPSPEVAARAIRGLGDIGPAAVELALPELTRFLAPEGHRHDDLCYQALFALTNLPARPGHLERLRPLLERDWEALDREGCVLPFLELGPLTFLLGRLGPAARDCVPGLERLLRLDDELIVPGTKASAAYALLQISSGNALALQTLERFARSDETQHRLDVVRDLEDLPPAVLASVRGLIEPLATGPDGEVRQTARRLLGQTGPGAIR